MSRYRMVGSCPRWALHKSRANGGRDDGSANSQPARGGNPSRCVNGGAGTAGRRADLPVGAAALIVAGALFAIAGVMALVGRGELRRAAPATPEQTLDSVKADVQTVTDAVRKKGH